MNAQHTLEDFHKRLVRATGTLSYREIGDLTETHPETVRRYMNGQAPSAVFLSRLCERLGISATWLLTNRAPMMSKDIERYTLEHASTDVLVKTVSEILITTLHRLDEIDPHKVDPESSKLQYTHYA